MNKNDESPLQNALQKGDVDVTLELMKKSTLENVEKSTIKQQSQDITLYLAAKIGNIEMVRRIIEIGGSGMARQPRSGSTPSHAAAYYNNPECLEYLIQKFPESCNVTNSSFGEPVISNAISTQGLSTLKLVIENTNDDILVNYADYSYCNGNCLLHIAAFTRKESLISLLIKSGKEGFLKYKNNDGKIPLDIAREVGASDSILALLKQ